MHSKKAPQKRKNTIADVARAAGVSKSTVSNYINDRHDLFSGETAVRIRKAISALRYIPDPGARGIKSQEGGKSLGILLRKRIDQVTTTPYFQQVLPGICDTMDDYGYRTLVIPETRDPQRDITYVRELAKGLLAGYFIFNIESAHDPYVEALQSDGVNYVCIGYNPSIDNFVASRHDLGAEEAVTHLIRDHGRKRVAIVTESAAKNADIDKMKGYRSGIEGNGLRFDPALVIAVDDRRAAMEALRKLMRRSARTRPDAILGPHSDLREIEAILDETRLGAPEDLGLVLFDPPADRPDSAYAFISIHSAQVGRAAADKMFKLLKGDPDGPGGVFLNVDFRPGRSCGCF